MTSALFIPVRRLTRICTGHFYPGRQAAPLDYRNIISFASDTQHNTLDQRTRRRMPKDIIAQDSKCLIFPSRYLYPFRIRVTGPLVVSSAFLSWELLAHPSVSFLFDLARRWLLHFFVSISSGFSQRSRLNRLGPRAQFLFSRRALISRPTHRPLSSTPHPVSPLLSSVWLSGNVSITTHTHCMLSHLSQSAFPLFFSIYHLDSSISTRDGAVSKQ